MIQYDHHILHCKIDHKETLLEEAMTEMKELSNEADEEETYLKTVLYTMEKNFNDMQNQLKTYRESKLQDYSNTVNKILFSQMHNTLFSTQFIRYIICVHGHYHDYIQ